MAEDEGTLDYQEVDSFEDDDEIILPDGAVDNEYESDDEDSGEASNNNPSLNELYDILPKSLHGMIEPVVSKWQSGIDREFEKMSGYRALADAGVSPDIIEASLELAQQISANPKAIYDELAERYGWQQAQQIMQEASDVASIAVEDEDGFSFDLGDEASAEVQALRAEVEALRYEREEEVAQATEARYEYEIETSLEYLREEYGDVDDNMIIRRAMMLSEEYPDAELPQLIGAAFEQYQQEVNQIAQQVGRRAPRVAGGAGNSMPAPEQVKLNSKEDRVAAIEQIAKQYGHFN
jgi:hypothetical protein